MLIRGQNFQSLNIFLIIPNQLPLFKESKSVTIFQLRHMVVTLCGFKNQRQPNSTSGLTKKVVGLSIFVKIPAANCSSPSGLQERFALSRKPRKLREAFVRKISIFMKRFIQNSRAQTDDLTYIEATALLSFDPLQDAIYVQKSQTPKCNSM